MADLDGTEVHLVYSARDLARQIARRVAGEHQAGPALELPAATSTRVAQRHAVVRARLRPARRARAAGAPACRPSACTWSPSRRPRGRGRARPAVAALLPGLRHRPGLGAAGERPRRTPRSAAPRPRCCAGSTSGSPARPARDAAYDDLILGMLAGDTLAGSRSRPILLPPEVPRLGHRARRGLDRVARGERRRRDRRRRRPAARAAGRGLPRTPTGSAPGRSSRPRSTRWPR